MIKIFKNGDTSGPGPQGQMGMAITHRLGPVHSYLPGAAPQGAKAPEPAFLGCPAWIWGFSPLPFSFASFVQFHHPAGSPPGLTPVTVEERGFQDQPAWADHLREAIWAMKAGG